MGKKKIFEKKIFEKKNFLLIVGWLVLGFGVSMDVQTVYIYIQIFGCGEKKFLKKKIFKKKIL
jgi:preprotein translocase subunit Sec63